MRKILILRQTQTGFVTSVSRLENGLGFVVNKKVTALTLFKISGSRLSENLKVVLSSGLLRRSSDDGSSNYLRNVDKFYSNLIFSQEVLF